jgi:hypothetical protein
MSVTYYVYALACPVERSVHYVGLSRQPTQRYEQHLYGAKNPSSEKDRWIASVVEKGMEPEFLILQTIHYTDVEGNPGYVHSDIDRREAERQWIKRLREAGHPLTNKIVSAEKRDEQELMSRAEARGREFVAALEVDARELLED